MKQIHFILKVCIIRYFIAVQMPRKYDQKETEKQIKILNEELQAGNLNHEEQRELIRNLTEKKSILEKLKNTWRRVPLSKQKWDINGEGTGKILLKCEETNVQQKYAKYSHRKTKEEKQKILSQEEE